MKHLKIYEINKWEWWLVILSIIALPICCVWLVKDYPNFVSILLGLSTGVITIVLILVLQRAHRNRKLFKAYNFLTGDYIRTDIGQDNTVDEKLENLRKQNNGLKINITYLGENRFSADMEYWKNDNARATGLFEFSETNKMIGSGTYKFYQGDLHKDHFGSLEVFRFSEESDRIYIKHQHVFPRSIRNNPDDNRGWQIWERI